MHRKEKVGLKPCLFRHDEPLAVHNYVLSCCHMVSLDQMLTLAFGVNGMSRVLIRGTSMSARVSLLLNILPCFRTSGDLPGARIVSEATP